MRKTVQHMISVSIAIFALAACRPNGSGPAIPSAGVNQGAISADSNPESTSQSQTDPSSLPFDATVAHRLTELPQNLQSDVTLCESTNHFYDLGKQACTELTVTKCSLYAPEFRALLDSTTHAPLDEYLATKAVSHRLYSCTEEGDNYVLHFYKFENNTVNYKKLNISKKIP